MSSTGQRYEAEQIVNLLQELDALTANGMAAAQVCKQIGISEQTYYRWHKVYGCLKVDQARKFMHIEAENARLKKLVA